MSQCERRGSSVSDAMSHIQERRVSIATGGDQLGSRRLSNISSLTAFSNKRRSIMHHRQSGIDWQGGSLANYCPKLANTYQMEPEKKFNSADITKLIYTVLEERLEDMKYESDKCRFLVVSLANEIRHRVKQMGFARYKIVCIVDMGSIDEQGLRVTSRCLWNKNQDNLASATYKNNTLFAVGTVFGVYHE